MAVWGAVVASACGACGSGPGEAQRAPAGAAPELTAVAPVVVPDAGPIPPPSRLACKPGTAPLAAPDRDPTWACTRPDGTRDGNAITLFPDGTVEIESHYSGGALDGTWIRHFPGGAIAESGAYRAGQPDGHWRQLGPMGAVLGEYELVAGTGTLVRWREAGPRYSATQLEGGVRAGVQTIYEADGSVVASSRYVAGALDGPHVTGTVGTIRVEEVFARGVRIGVRRIWQQGTKIAESAYDDQGRLHGPFTEWRSLRIPRLVGQYAHGKRAGAWTWFDRYKNKEREGAYVAGKRDGTWIERDEGKVTFTGTYAAGMPDGAFVYLDRKGNEIGRSTLSAGSGVLKTFYWNGKTASEQTFVAGLEDGPYRELTPGGRATVEGMYRAGDRHGAWTERSASGTPILEQHWEHGRLDGTVKKYAGGALSLHATYADGAPTGAYTEYRDGKPAVTGQYAAGARTGTWITRTADSGTVTATYVDGVLAGPWERARAGVTEAGTMANGRRTGTWTTTDARAIVTTVTYVAP